MTGQVEEGSFGEPSRGAISLCCSCLSTEALPPALPVGPQERPKGLADQTPIIGYPIGLPCLVV